VESVNLAGVVHFTSFHETLGKDQKQLPLGKLELPQPNTWRNLMM